VTEEEAQLAAARPRKVRRKRIKANLKAEMGSESNEKLHLTSFNPEIYGFHRG
jgi:hypothetical protein